MERARIRAILIVGGLGFGVLLWQTYQKSLTYSDRLQELDETKFQIDINRAPSHELQLLPGVGEKMSENITQYRQSHGSIHSSEQLQELRGIGPKKADQMLPFIEFGAVK